MGFTNGQRVVWQSPWGPAVGTVTRTVTSRAAWWLPVPVKLDSGLLVLAHHWRVRAVLR